MDKKRHPELLCPAGSLQLLKIAVRYGADAVYLGGEAFSLRAKASNFTHDEMAEGIAYAHAHGVKVYVTANIFAHEADLSAAAAYFRELAELRPDGILVADPGMFVLARENCPDIPLHISTQANTTNSVSAKFWHSLGATRIVAARELGFAELRQIRDALPEDLSLEAFVHGAMCISYSGRCLLSNYLVGRDANRGLCTHPCRWKYAVFREAADENAADKRVDMTAEGRAEALQTGGSGKCPASKAEDGHLPCEEREIDGRKMTEGGHLPCAESGYAVQEATRPGEYFPIEENERGTFLFNSKDLCMIGHLAELYAAGIDSFKIEGRMKTALYVAACARTYRMAMDDFEKDPELYQSRIPWYMQQIAACTTRTFTTGFYFGKPGTDEQIYENSTYVTGSTYLGLVEGVRSDGRVFLHQKNKFCVGDMIEIMKPDGRNVQARVLSIQNGEGGEMPSAPHAGEELSVLLASDVAAKPWDILRTPAEA